MPTPPSIFDYTDYRLFLRNRVEWLRVNKSLSLESLARRSACFSKSLLSLVINGRRNLSNSKILPLARGLNLGPQETDYFCLMVALAQARSNDERARHGAALQTALRLVDRGRTVENSELSCQIRLCLAPDARLQARERIRKFIEDLAELGQPADAGSDFQFEVHLRLFEAI